MNEEKRKFIELLRQLKFEQIKEIYYMSKGANVVAKGLKDSRE